MQITAKLVFWAVICVIVVLAVSIRWLQRDILFNGFNDYATGTFSTRYRIANMSSENAIYNNVSTLFPSLKNYKEDRIIQQLDYMTKHVDKSSKNKTILVHNGLQRFSGIDGFMTGTCAKDCQVVGRTHNISEVDAIIFREVPAKIKGFRPSNQVWILFMLESPYHNPRLSDFDDVINWTATYRHDSVVEAPYNKFMPCNQSIFPERQNETQVKNYALGKSKKVAWFVSNCADRNGRRIYAAELAKYIEVDIYGACGTLRCPREKKEKCFDMLNKHYKFYLAFENSSCRDYITEKFFINGLGHDVIPIVMGAAPEDYRRVAPSPHSYIHVDEFESPKALAEYLHKLDKNDDLYNEYFNWKGTFSLIHTANFYCRLCSMLHEVENTPPFYYHNLEKWWRGPGICIGRESWRSRKNIPRFIVENY